MCKDLAEYKDEIHKWCGDIYTFNKYLTPETCKDAVVVVDMGGIPGGLWGSEIGASTKIKGLEGVVIDGACRDTYECNIEKVNAFCTKRTFNHVYGRFENGGVNVPITCAGVKVNPGDIICADDDGVLVIPRDRAEEVVKFAVAILEGDQRQRAEHYRKLGMEPDETLDRMNTR